MDKHSKSDLKLGASIVGCTELSINSLMLLFYFYYYFDNLPEFVKIAFIGEFLFMKLPEFGWIIFPL